jgi:hypothetical protein
MERSWSFSGAFHFFQGKSKKEGQRRLDKRMLNTENKDEHLMECRFVC